jgi:hypothetical protein
MCAVTINIIKLYGHPMANKSSQIGFNLNSSLYMPGKRGSQLLYQYVWRYDKTLAPLVISRDTIG